MFAMDRSRLISAFLFTKQLTNYTACFLSMVALVLGPCQAIAAESPEPSAEPRAPVPLQMAVMSLPDGQVQSAYHAMLAAEGGAKPYRWSVSDALPAGLALDADTGAITGSPSSSGQTTLTVTVTDSAPAPRSSAKQLSITVAAVAKQVQIANGSLPGGQVDATYRGLLVASGGALPYTWTILSGSLPAGLALDAATGDLTGTPATPGNYGFTVKVTSSSLFAEPATKRFSIAVAAARAPFAPPINLPVQPDSATLPALELPASPDNATAESS